MTQFQIYSDIHVEFSKQFPRVKPLCDYLILAGDICILNDKNFTPLMDYCSKNWKIVVYVLGNHEFYLKKVSKHSYYAEGSYSINSIVQKYKNVLHSYYPNVYLLENEYIDLNDELRIYGTTMWTNHPYTTGLNDYLFVKYDDIIDTSNYEKESLVKYLSSNTKKTIIVTHFPLISEGTSNPKYDETNPYFSWKDLVKDLPNENIIACVAGHTHYSFDITKNNIRYLSNQFGYRNELSESNLNPEGLYTI